jgi:hypothetical protein
MILFLQFTITDTRYFSDFRHELLSKPVWPSPRPFREFVRNTGNIIERNKGGQEGWVGENYICEINKGIKFSKQELSNGITVNNVSKHMFASEHYVLTKYEFVFNVKTAAIGGLITHDLMKGLINEFLLSTASIKLNGKVQNVRINQLPVALMNFHYQNSTVSTFKNDRQSIKHLIYCTPQLYFYLDRNESAKGLDRNYRHIARIFNIAELYGAWHDHRNNPFRLWIHKRITNSARELKNRELRMKIMRLHSEYECLKNIFNAVSNGLISPSERSNVSEELQRYFNTAIRTFLLDEKNLEYESWTPGFFDYFSKIFSKAAPGELERIKEQINHFRPNIKNKAINFYIDIKFVNNKFENNHSNILSQGDNNIVQNNQVAQQANRQNAEIDFNKLLDELNLVLKNAKETAVTTDDFKAVTALSEVKDAAEKQDSSGVMSVLKGSGRILYDVGTKFTASFLVELLKAQGIF